MSSLDAKTLAALLAALKSGKLQLALGGKGGGKLWGGKGVVTKPMKENPNDKENIPAPYRKQVKEYFESIKPQSRQSRFESHSLVGTEIMPALDTYHNVGKNALVKDGWTITHDPLTLTYGQTDVFVDLG